MNVSELQKTLRAADQAAVLVSSRILEKVIREAYRLPNLHFNIPHWKSFVCDRHQLFKHADQADLELDSNQLLPATVILLVRPEDEETSSLEKKVLLLKYWRMLFHARVHLAVDALELSEQAVRQRVEAIGRTEFEEVRAVLVQDRYLPHDADDRAVYTELAAVFLELRHFAGGLLRHCFPGIRDHAAVEALLDQDVNPAALFGATRLSGAPDPVMLTDTRSDESQEAYWKFVRAAQKAVLRGNVVRAAILQVRASRVAPAAETITARKEAEKNIAQLTERFATAIQLDDAETADWTRHLTLLLDKADQGTRPMEARVLEDVQKVCLDEEQQVYTLDVVEYLLSGGKRPIKRPLPSQKQVRITNHLRAALAKLGEIRLADGDRNHLTRLFETALRRTEARLRTRFAPVLTTAMEDVGLAPADPIEQAAFDKMVGELLDHISRNGLLTFAELRDTISRNQLKLPDVTEPDQFIRGDPLIRLDRRLGALLDGVYRPGDFYVRWLEQGMSLLFGTWWGRPLFLYFLLPFGVALMVVQLLGVVVLWGARQAGYERVPPLTEAGLVLHLPGTLGKEIDAIPEELRPPWQTHLWWNLGLLGGAGLFVSAQIHLRWVRRLTIRGLRLLWKMLRGLLWDVPLLVVPLSTLREVLRSWPLRLLYWYLVRPALVCALLYPLLAGRLRSPWWWVGIFILIAYLTSSPVGIAAGEAILDALINLGRMIRAGLIPALVRFTLHVFKRTLDAIEYVLFRVDEWLRFRAGDSQASLFARALIGVAWFPVAFVIRLYTVVLIEPMVNPVKLPFSMLFAKIVYPILIVAGWFTIQPLGSPLLDELMPPPYEGVYVLWYAAAWLLVVCTLYLSPDAVTFLVWEMKENWQLYRANRAATLQPSVVGSHGETVRGLLQPGFHSGTVPAVYQRLRWAERHAARTRNWHTARAYRHELGEIAGVLGRFLDRELLALLRQSRSWQGVQVEAGPVRLATNRVEFELLHGLYPDDPVRVEIEHHHNWILAGVRSTGWLSRLNEEQLRAFTTALAGLYKRADVDLVREQLIACVPRPPVAAQLAYEGLIVWEEAGSPPVRYPLREGFKHPDWSAKLGEASFGRTPIRWAEWVSCWQRDQKGEPHPGLPGLAGQLICLPAPPVGPSDNGQPDGEQSAAAAVSSSQVNVGRTSPQPQE